MGSLWDSFRASAGKAFEKIGLGDPSGTRQKKKTSTFIVRRDAVYSLADALLSLDGGGQLVDLLAPYRRGGEGIKEALVNYLTADGLPARAAPPLLLYSGSYLTQQQVLLGEEGFRKAALLMFDYALDLPSGRQVVCCAHSGLGFFMDNAPFTLQFLQKMSDAAERGSTFLIISPRKEGTEEDARLALVWLAAHLKGFLRSRLYDEDAPAEYFVGSIPGFWSLKTEHDPSAEDELISIMYTDPRNTRGAEAHCGIYIQKSLPSGQYGFLDTPQGDEGDNKQGWVPGPLPKWDKPDAAVPDGCFSAICRIPTIGVITKAELGKALAEETVPDMPDYLFRDEAGFSPGPHRIILCENDVRESLIKERVYSAPLSTLLRRRTFISHNTLAAMLTRLLDAMTEDESFQVALLPRNVFDKLELEIVCWQDSASVGWLQDCSGSVFDNDPISSGNYHMAVNHVWNSLPKVWKRRSMVMRTLRKWLAGKGLDEQDQDEDDSEIDFVPFRTPS